VRGLRERKLRVYALSDWSAETFPFARTTVRELDLFDDIQISGEVRLTKPDPRTFAAAARRFKVEPTKTLFVDDIAANVAGRAHIRLLRDPVHDGQSPAR